MSEEFYWWTWSKISGDHRLSCSPSASTSTACRFALKICIEFEERLLYKKNEFDPEKLIFLWKTYKKIIVSKPIKHNKNVDTLLFLLSVTKCQREKKYWKNIICEYRRTKRVRISGFWNYFWTISTRSKKQISSRIYIYIKYICLAFNWQR